MVTKARGRPPSPLIGAVQSVSPKYAAVLARAANRVNGEVLTSSEDSATALQKTRREILKHYQFEGGATANAVRSDERKVRLAKITEALNDPRRSQLSTKRMAEILSEQLGRSPHTLRKDIAEIRKLTGPTS